MGISWWSVVRAPCFLLRAQVQCSSGTKILQVTLCSQKTNKQESLWLCCDKDSFLDLILLILTQRNPSFWLSSDLGLCSWPTFSSFLENPDELLKILPLWCLIAWPDSERILPSCLAKILPYLLVSFLSTNPLPASGYINPFLLLYLKLSSISLP